MGLSALMSSRQFGLTVPGVYLSCKFGQHFSAPDAAINCFQRSTNLICGSVQEGLICSPSIKYAIHASSSAFKMRMWNEMGNDSLQGGREMGL